MVTGNQIRLLSLHPQTHDAEDDIRCELEVVSLDDKPQYEALSYLWGDNTSLVNISITGRQVGVTQNLITALRRLRLSNRPRLLWIDQLCINQWDVNEKAHQVRLMREIYTRCQNCVIWLGEVKDEVGVVNAEAAFALLAYMATTSEPGFDKGAPPPDFIQSSEKFTGLMTAIDDLQKNPWWTRVWTVQEAVLPASSTILWGSHSLQWSQLSQAATHGWDFIPARLMEHLQANHRHVELFTWLFANVIWREIAKDRSDSPAYMVQRWRFQKATDHRDKIYALLGLCPRGSLSIVEECDYSLSPVDVFCNLTMDLVLSEESLLPLSMDPRLESDKATPGIPRWALDVSHISDRNTDWFHLYAWPHYHADGGRSWDTQRTHARWLAAKHILEVEGIYVDRIVKVGEPWFVGEGIDASGEARLERIRSWQQLVKNSENWEAETSSQPYPGCGSLHQAFGRLMLGDLIRNDEQWVEKAATEADIEASYSYLASGQQNSTHRTICGMMCNQRFFVTATGLIGLGHWDTEPGDEVWVLFGGNFPFTMKNGVGADAADCDFGGRCYVQGIMNGEALKDGRNSQIVRLH